MIDAPRPSLARLSSFFRGARMDRELEAEMAAHLEFATEENVQHGMTAEEARRQDFVHFGVTQQAKEINRDLRGIPALDELHQDLRYTFRTLRKDRAFAVIAILILALGIGANIAVFSVVNTILLRPLPFRDSQQLVRIVEKDAKGGESGKTYTADATQDFQQQNRSFQSVSGYFAFTGPNNFKLSGTGQPVPATGMPVAEGFFETL